MSNPNPQKPEEALLTLRVTPRASRSKLGRDAEGGLKAWVCAPPVDGAANEAVRVLLADVLQVPKGSVEVVSGHSHRNKTLRVIGLSQEEALTRIGL